MTVFYPPAIPEIRKAPPTPATVNSTTVPVTAWSLTSTRTALIRKIHAYNGDSAPTLLQIGTGIGTFVQRLPSIYLVNGQDTEIPEDQIPSVEFTADITAQMSARVAGNVILTLEVGERQGSTVHA